MEQAPQFTFQVDRQRSVARSSSAATSVNDSERSSDTWLGDSLGAGRWSPDIFSLVGLMVIISCCIAKTMCIYIFIYYTYICVYITYIIVMYSMILTYCNAIYI